MREFPRRRIRRQRDHHVGRFQRFEGACCREVVLRLDRPKEDVALESCGKHVGDIETWRLYGSSTSCAMRQDAGEACARPRCRRPASSPSVAPVTSANAAATSRKSANAGSRCASAPSTIRRRDRLSKLARNGTVRLRGLYASEHGRDRSRCSVAACAHGRSGHREQVLEHVGAVRREIVGDRKQIFVTLRVDERNASAAASQPCGFGARSAALPYAGWSR